MDFQLNKPFYDFGNALPDHKLMYYEMHHTNIQPLRISRGNRRALREFLSPLLPIAERERCMKRLQKANIMQCMLRGINDEDLQIVGVCDEQKRAELLKHSGGIADKYPSYDE